MPVLEICTREVVTAAPDDTVFAAARLMLEQGVGSVVVLEDARPVGILTDRDITVRVVAVGLNPETTRIRTVMSGNPRTVLETTGVEDTLRLMQAAGVRRIPVVDASGALAGIVSLGDFLDLLAGTPEAPPPLLRRLAQAARPPE
ncbi:CBS domain-containing protein [Dissulfurirhabdus thermomarina]|uniref:CBS domain-containing protein n=2 Tax=Dissulfurirhabdus thermomarina TaxID=1765737 RepID=A0A6N9TK28_DISTH|nr:CBS domain-containing protein [Dissulfurirhabdus thermomarina]NMX24279.1 CBS domain-containing protein [Dissulfurirhabdus thermomarina]